ncbi:DUF3419 family protein [Ferdinandcohnia sp. Marseille-Q9671]
MSDIFFSQIREDSLVEREVSRKVKPKKTLVIGSGGCTAFSILDDSVQHVLCVDVNPAQCALIELKKAAIRYFSLKDYLAFVGESPCHFRLEMYECVADDLPESVKNYWENHRNQIEFGINQCGVNERFYRFIGENICKNIYDESIWNELLLAKNLDEQIKFYKKYLTTPEWQTAARLLLSKTSHLQFFPSYMFANASENDFGNFFLRQFEKEIKSRPIQNNYFLSQLLLSTYLYKHVGGVPFYLSDEGYDTAKRNIDKLTIHPESLQGLLEKESSIDAFYLSNVFDWADTQGREAICSGILHAKSEGAIVLFRNMLSSTQLPTSFMKQFHINEELSKKCEAIERSMLYQKITVGQFV